LIDQTFIHCSGIGPKTDQRLKTSGFRTWSDCLANPDAVPFSGKKKSAFLRQIGQSQSALLANDISYLVQSLPTREHWRILGTYFNQATFFDIETTGLSSYDSIITVIVAFHKGQLHTFLFRENLDQFLDLVEQSDLLVTFNGNSFDIPFVENAFNIPNIGCPFIDLRWICYHLNYSGGLKAIEKQLNIQRPEQIASVDGFEAISLFLDWQNGNLNAKRKLIAYCQADVLSVYLVAHTILCQLGMLGTEVNRDKLFATICC
jgi:hypothetical protein